MRGWPGPPSRTGGHFGPCPILARHSAQNDRHSCQLPGCTGPSAQVSSPSRSVASRRRLRRTRNQASRRSFRGPSLPFALAHARRAEPREEAGKTHLTSSLADSGLPRPPGNYEGTKATCNCPACVRGALPFRSNGGVGGFSSGTPVGRDQHSRRFSRRAGLDSHVRLPPMVAGFLPIRLIVSKRTNDLF